MLRKKFIQELSQYRHQKPIYGFSLGIEEPPEDDISFFKHVYARDRVTINILKSLNIPCSFIPDVAMILQPDTQQGNEWIQNTFQQEKHDLYSKKIAVIINSYMMNGTLGSLARDALNFMKFSYDFARTADETSASFIFIPFGTQLPFDDRISNAWIASKCKYWKKNYLCLDRLNYHTTLDIISACDLTISSRLHSSVFSYISGTPFIDITHHSKNALFLEMIKKQENSVSFWNFNVEEFKNKIHLMLDTPRHQESQPFKEQILDRVHAIHFDQRIE